MKNELKQHKKSDKIKWIVIFSAVILLATALTATITKGFKDWNPYGWFGEKEQNQTETEVLQVPSKSLRSDIMDLPNISEVPVPILTIEANPYSGIVVMEAFAKSVKSQYLDNPFEQYDLIGFDIQLFSAESIDGQMEYFGEVNIREAYLNGLVARVPFKTIFPDVPSGRYSFSFSSCYYSSTSGNKSNMAGAQNVLNTDPLALPPDPVKDGHTFLGWYLDQALTQPYDGREITSDMEFHAKFQIHTYTVSFVSNSDIAIPSQTVNWGTVFTPAMLPTNDKTGYDFVGWFLPDGTKYTNQPIKADITLKAEWSIKIFKVTFYVDGTVYHTINVEYGQSLAKVIEKENLALNVKSVVNNNGTPIDTAINELTVTTDLIANADLKNTAQTALTNLPKLLIGSALAIALVAFLCCIPSMVKGKKHRRKV